MKKAALTLVTMLVLFSCNKPSQLDQTSTPTAGLKGPAPEFELEDVAGGTLKSAELKGKVAVIDIWATWCEPCITEIPKFNDLYDEYKDKDVRVIGITTQSPKGDIAPKAKELGMKYSVVVGDDAVVDGFGGVIGWPTTFVLTKDWRIYKKYLGALPDKEARIKKDIEKLLSDPL